MKATPATSCVEMGTAAAVFSLSCPELAFFRLLNLALLGKLGLRNVLILRKALLFGFLW